jgi:hypothetical protein
MRVSSNGSQSKARSRSGAVLIAVLTCVLIVVALLGGAIKSTLTARRQSKLELQMQQAELLLQAGLDRLVLLNEDFAQSSVWDAKAALHDFAIAEVVYQPEVKDGEMWVRCTARLGVGSSPEAAIQLSRDVPIELQSTTLPSTEP